MATTRIPLFPLPVVLFPGMRMPLHIFEPRYQQIVKDCLNADRTFGLIHRADDIEEREIPAGSVGCRARIGDVEPQPNGRSNIVVTGGERFSIVSIDPDSAPYLVAFVKPFTDLDEPTPQLTALALKLSELFVEAAADARTIADDASPVPPLASSPQDIAFSVAATIEMDAASRQRLLASPSPSARMRELITLIDESLPLLHDRAAAHRRSKLNGHAPRTQT